MQRASLSLAFLIILTLMPMESRAHVVVYPREAKAGSYEAFTVRCPNEKDKATIKVALEIPADAVAIHHYEPKPGWQITLEKNTSGDATKVTWTADGAGLLPDQFVEFRIMGKINAEAKAIGWKAYQTYEGDEVVEWTGEAGSKTPAPVTKLGATAKSDEPATTATPVDGKAKLAFNLALGALLASVVAILLGFLRK